MTRHAIRATLTRRPLVVVTSAMVAVVVAYVNFYRLGAAPALADEWEYQRMGWNYWHWGQLPAKLRTLPTSNGEHVLFAKFLMGLGQVLVGHPSLTAARGVCALCGVLAALALGWWIARETTPWWGLATVALVGTMPLSVYPLITRFTRAAMLDTPALLFMVVAIVALWWWCHDHTSRSWRGAVVAGVLAGLAVSSKETAALGLIGPGLAACHQAWRSTHERRRVITQVMAMTLIALVVLVGSFLPLGHLRTRLTYLWHFQLQHSAHGHLVGVAGQITRHPAWWANFWFAQRGMGTTFSLALVGLVVIALVWRRDRITRWLTSALLPAIFFLCFVEGMTLPYYWVMWAPLVVLLAMLGAAELVTRARRSHGASRRALSLVAVVAALALITPCVTQLTRTWSLHVEGPQKVAQIRGDSTSLVLVGALDEVYPTEYLPYLPASAIRVNPSGSLVHVGWVAVGHAPCPRPPYRLFRAIVAEGLRAGTLRRVYSDRLLTLYRVVGHLSTPSAAVVASLPVFPPSQLCRGN